MVQPTKINRRDIVPIKYAVRRFIRGTVRASVVALTKPQQVSARLISLFTRLSCIPTLSRILDKK